MFGQRPRSYPVVLALCSVSLLLFGLSRHMSRRILSTGGPGPVVATSDSYTVERVDSGEGVRVNQSKMEEQIVEGDPEEIVNPDFYSDAYWSTSLEKRSEVCACVFHMCMHDASSLLIRR